MSNMLELGILLSLTDSASGPLRVFTNSLSQGVAQGMNGLQRLGTALDAMGNRMIALGASSKAVGGEIMHFVEKPIHAFEEMDSALNDLAVASLDKTGKIGDGFDAIKEKVLQIDARLPMTTAQVSEVGTALMNLGTTKEQLLGGALDAAANLSVVMKMSPEAAGEMTAKVREAYQLQGNELPKAADLIQRISFAGGIKPGEQLEFMKYASPNINALGLTGLTNAKGIGALQVELGRMGIASSQAGTEIGGLLSDLSSGPRKLMMARKGMRGAAKEEMIKAGLGNVSFFDAQGMLKGGKDGTGIQNMVTTLSDMYTKLMKSGGQRGVIDVFNGMFGAEHGRAAILLAKNGVDAYTDSLKRLDDQASIDQRIGVTMQSFKNRMTVLGSNVTNALAAWAAPALEMLEPYLDKLSDGIADMREWINHHKTFAKWTFLIAGGLGVVLSTLGSIALASGFAVKLAGAPLRHLGSLGSGGFSAIKSIGKGLGSGLLEVGTRIPGVSSMIRSFAMALSMNGGGLGAVIPTIIQGLGALGSAFLAIPGIGWITAAVVVVGVLIYKYWKPIKAFFAGFWTGLKRGLGPSFSAIGQALSHLGSALAKVFQPFMPVVNVVVGWFKQLWHWATELLKPVDDTGGAARSMGESFGLALGKIMGSFGKLWAGLLNFEAKFLEFGEHIVTGLISGIGNKMAAARDAIVKLGGNIKTWFTQTLGIHSPSRVFIGFGKNIGEGAELGMLSKLGSVQDTAARLAGAAAQAATGHRVNTALATAAKAGHPSDTMGGQSTGGHVIHFAPTLHVAGGPNVREQVGDAMRTSYAEFEKLMKRWQASNARTSF
ncbi:phage tail tape measure protein [Burkholderia sp. Ac-20345]|uniref:phage tail tape measure protein n=1 Tax=Burkholderia sp. Ac-20345 TaxID=2703891 RepID=UPI00197C0FE6|nr:phage tail tape measure protein [Burkholderia sp. Ac-20345]MBN3779917.1 phage tail tape measure protein [Burkholderia sp. Ac-20345]